MDLAPRSAQDGDPYSQPVGRWWLTYDDGTVWPCEVVSVFSAAPMGAAGNAVEVLPVVPAPDAGTSRIVHADAVYDNRFNHPERTA